MFRIFVDWDAPPEAMPVLLAGTSGHELRMAGAPTSVLEKSGADPQMFGADIVFGQPDPDALASVPRLKWVHISSSGVTRYDTPEFRAELTRRGIVLTHSPTVYAASCAEQALSFMLAQSRQLPEALRVRPIIGTPAWNALRGAMISPRGQRALILGFGAIGRRLVELLRPFDMSITAFRRRPRGDEGIPAIGPNELGAALGETDHVINLLPESTETRAFFNASRLAAIRSGAVFYNIGRGATVDQDALGDALRSGRLRAAWLDVTDPEPLPEDHPLRAEPRCHITPHVAGGQAGETTALIRHFLGNLNRFIRKDPLLDRLV